MARFGFGGGPCRSEREAAQNALVATSAAASSSPTMGGYEQVLAEQAIESLRQRLAGQWPLLYAATEFRGASSDYTPVNCNAGVLVLLDAPVSERVGRYELLYYAAVGGGGGEVDTVQAARVHIGPRSTITQLPSGVLHYSFHGVQAGPDCYTIMLANEADRGPFLRDFTVRQRVMALSLRTARGQHALAGLAGEISALHRRHPVQQLKRLLLRASLLAAACFAARVAFVLQFGGGELQQGAGALDVTWLALGEAATGAGYVGGAVARSASAVCGLVSSAPGQVPVAAVERCLSAVGIEATRRCLSELVPAPAYAEMRDVCLDGTPAVHGVGCAGGHPAPQGGDTWDEAARL